MKIIGRAEQKKIDLQIENLQKKVAELESQLSAAKAEHKKLDAAATKAQADSNKALVESAKALAEAKAQLDVKAKELTAKAAELAAAQTAAKSEAASAKSQLDASVKQLSEATQENELLLSQLMQVQEELEKIFLDKKQIEATSAKAQADAKTQAEKLQQTTKQFEAEVAKLNASLATANSELTKLKQDLANQQKSKQAAEAALAELKAKSPAELKAVTDKYQQQAKAAQALEADLAKHKAELALAQQALATAKADISKTQQAKLELDTLQARTLSELEQLKKESAQQDTQQVAKLKDAAQENELLLMQLMQVQEELESYYLEKIRLEKLHKDNQARWDRLAKRLPNYLDFGAIEIIDVDGVSDVPSITWQVKDFAQAGVALSEFSFVTVLQDGHPGIGLVKDGQPHAFVPKLLGANKDHVATFLGLGTTEFKQLTAAVSILDQLEAGQWKGFEFPAQFDLNFWRPSIQTLLAQLKLLPALLRYDEVRLKRELINPDYEHLWLEFRGLSLGAAHWKKFEIRLGAALVQHDGFSQYPKFEIPLIDGKTKPFDSWYAESQDDSGAKLELRFALDKNVFDVAVWAKLADADKALLMRLIYAMPDALKRLEKQKTAIHRPWATWIDFATGAVKVLEVNKAAAKLPAPEAAETEAPVKTKTSKALPAPAAQAKLPAPAKLTNTGAKAGKVISITARPMAKPAPKPKAKPATSKVTAKTVTKSAVKPAAKTTRKSKA